MKVVKLILRQSLNIKHIQDIHETEWFRSVSGDEQLGVFHTVSLTSIMKLMKILWAEWKWK